MTDFNPPISTRDSSDLLDIALDNGEHWNLDAIELAKTELKKRGLTDDEFKKYNSKSEQRDKNLQRTLDKELEKRKAESYHPFQMILIFLFSIFIILKPIISSDKSIFELKSEGYLLKYKQRLSLLLGGLFCWVILIWYIQTH